MPATLCSRYRVVRGDMSSPDFAASCADLLAQHPKDLLQWCSLVKVRGGGEGRVCAALPHSEGKIRPAPFVCVW